MLRSGYPNRTETRKLALGFLEVTRLEVCARVVVTDRLASYAAPYAALLPNTVHRRDKGLNNRAENSPQSTRERERRMRGFKSAGHAQRFLSIFGLVADVRCGPSLAVGAELSGGFEPPVY
jgi:putative transposase